MTAVKEWPLPVKRKAFQLYLQRYPSPEISRRTGASAGTIRRWTSREKWFDIRDTMPLNLDAVARDLVRDSLTCLSGAIRTSSKLLTHIEGQLDAQDASEGTQIDSAILADLASALKDSADVLLRVFNK